MRIRIEVIIERCFKQGCHIDRGNGSQHWVNFKYEKFPDFCYICGIVDHTERACPIRRPGNKTEIEGDYWFEPWLRVQDLNRSPSSGIRNIKSSFAKSGPDTLAVTNLLHTDENNSPAKERVPVTNAQVRIPRKTSETFNLNHPTRTPFSDISNKQTQKLLTNSNPLSATISFSSLEGQLPNYAILLKPPIDCTINPNNSNPPFTTHPQSLITSNMGPHPSPLLGPQFLTITGPTQDILTLENHQFTRSPILNQIISPFNLTHQKYGIKRPNPFEVITTNGLRPDRFPMSIWILKIFKFSMKR